MDFFFMSFISKGISYVFFCELFSKGLSLIKLKLVSFFIARYLTDSLRGPVLTLRRGAERRVSGWGGVGWDGVSKVSFNFLYALWIYRAEW